jgi:hypothetical protein
MRALILARRPPSLANGPPPCAKPALLPRSGKAEASIAGTDITMSKKAKKNFFIQNLPVCLLKNNQEM